MIIIVCLLLYNVFCCVLFTFYDIIDCIYWGRSDSLFLLLVIVGVVYAFHEYLAVIDTVSQCLFQQYAYLAAICVACYHSIKVFVLVYFAQ